jgi:DNA processing protein
MGTGGQAPRSRRGVVMTSFSSSTDSRDSLLDFISLSLLPSWCWVAAAEGLRAGGAPRDVFARLAHVHWRGAVAEVQAIRDRAASALDRGRAASLTPVAWSNPAYPAALAAILDPPAMLWTRGSLDALTAPTVAIVGSRAASPYALSVAGTLAADLASRGVAIVSGLARGVDSAAHRGALDADGVTIAVLGSGLDVIYPAEHAGLARDIARRGVVMSELAPGTPPLPWCFPLRNRIISGLSRAVVVIEASEKSGSLITARCALEQGRDVLAVPGNVLSGRNRGAHALLKDGAKVVESADDILEELGMCADARPSTRSGRATVSDPILECLTPGEPIDLDEIAERSGLTPARLLPRLMELELRGAIARVGGGRFVRVDRNVLG